MDRHQDFHHPPLGIGYSTWGLLCQLSRRVVCRQGNPRCTGSMSRCRDSVPRSQLCSRRLCSRGRIGPRNGHLRLGLPSRSCRQRAQSRRCCICLNNPNGAPSCACRPIYTDRVWGRQNLDSIFCELALFVCVLKSACINVSQGSSYLVGHRFLPSLFVLHRPTAVKPLSQNALQSEI